MIGLVLCGGKGTRLSDVLPAGLPKCGVIIEGRPLWEYATMATHQVTNAVYLAIGPFDLHTLRIPPSYENWLVEDEQKGSVAVINSLRHRVPGPALLVMNGDTVYFGKLPQDIPNKGILQVIGLDLVKGEPTPACHIIGAHTKLKTEAKNIEDLPPTSVLDLSESLRFIDAGTPQGLRVALRISANWSR